MTDELQQLETTLSKTRISPRQREKLLKKAEKFERSKWSKKRAVGKEIRAWVEAHNNE